jgi:hypothetical protein
LEKGTAEERSVLFAKKEEEERSVQFSYQLLPSF